MLALALVVAALGPALGPGEVVRVQARPELPWVVAVAALDADVPRADLDKAVAVTNEALAEVGAAAHLEQLAGRPAIVVEGPPETHDVVVSAARKAAITAAGAGKVPRLVLFVDGRTPLTNKGALPPRSSAGSSSPRSFAETAGAANARRSLPLAPTPGLLDVEGEALALFVEQALSVGVSVRAEHGRAALVLDGVALAGAPTPEQGRAALEAAVAAPLPWRLVEELRRRAHGRIAARRAGAGGWARDMATMWLAFGSLDVEEPADLGSSLRARVFPAVLVR